MSRAAYLGLIAATCLTLTGCGGSRTTYKYRVAVIPKGLTHEFWQSIHRGAVRAGADLKAEQGLAVEVLWDGPRKENEALEQINLIDQKVAMGIQGLVLAPQDSKQMVAPVERAVAEGVKVVIIDSGLDKEALKEKPDLIVKYVATNNFNGGRLAAEKLLARLAREGKTEPKVVLFRYATGSESTEQREEGFLSYVKEVNEKKQTVTVVPGDYYAGPTVETAEKEAGPLLARLGADGVDGIFAVNESSTSGMLNALRKQGLNGKVRLVGFDSSEPLLQAVRDKDVDGLVVQDPYRMGYLGVWILVQALEGYDVSEGGLDLGTGEVFLTLDNLDSAEMRGRFDAAAQAQRKMEVPKFEKK
jgi:ribose transport system substrate-binding protein